MLHDVFNRAIVRVKGDDYIIDRRIPASYLIGLGWDRLVMRARGAVLFPRGPHPFIGRGARFKARRRLSFGPATTFGYATYVDALSSRGVQFGSNVSLGRNTRIECTGSLRTIGVGIEVGDNVGLGSDSFYGCAGGITIGSDTIVGNLVTMHSENHRHDDANTPIRLQGVTHAGIEVGADCWIGAKATILDGARIEDGCIIAAGSVVVAGRYPAGGIYGGVPARRIASRVTDGREDSQKQD